MRRPGIRALSLYLLLLLLLVPCPSPAAGHAAKYIFKVATLAPEGSVWVNQFQEFAKEVADKSGGEIQFKLYTGGIMGDDQAMYRKIRVGQLNGGGFTMTGIADVIPDFRVLAIPFLFRSYDEVDAVCKALVPYFKNKFRDQGLEFIAMTEVGFIYTMSTQPVASMADLKKGKSWAPSGDPITGTFFSQSWHHPHSVIHSRRPLIAADRHGGYGF